MRDLEEEVLSIRCKGVEDKGRLEDGLRIDPRGDFAINGVEGVEEGVAPIDMSLASISKGGGGVSEDAGEGSMTGPTRSCSTLSRSCYRVGSSYWTSASFYHRRSWPLGRAAYIPPSSYSWPPAAWDASWWCTKTAWR